MTSSDYKNISTDDNTEQVSLVSFIFFQWMNSIFKTGSERPLEQDDFLPLSNENTACAATELLQTKWNDEMINSKGKDNRPKLWKSVVKTLSVKEVTVVIFSCALYAICCLLAPLFLGYLITLLTSDEPQERKVIYGCVLAVAMSINALVGCLGMQHLSYSGEILGIRISSAIRGLVYGKVSK